MAMFACVTSGQCSLAESVFTLYVRMGERPDAALYTLFLRALLQQGKWAEGMQLFRRMLTGKASCGRPNHHTLNTLLQYQVVDGHWSEALKTLDLVLMFQKPPSKDRQQQSQQPSSSFANLAGNSDSNSNSGSSSSGGASSSSNAIIGFDSNPEFSELYILARKIFQRNRRSLFASQVGDVPLIPYPWITVCRCIFHFATISTLNMTPLLFCCPHRADTHLRCRAHSWLWPRGSDHTHRRYATTRTWTSDGIYPLTMPISYTCRNRRRCSIHS